MSKPTPRVVKLADLVPDSRNANKGTLRGLAMLDDSLREDGAGRGILLDRNNNIIAGNKTVERAIDDGFEEIIVVPTDGKQLVATQRVDVDLDSPQGRRMGLRDNRVAQVDLEFDPDVLKGLQDDGVDLSALWDADELAELLASVDGGTPAADPGAQTDRAEELQAKWQVLVGETWRIPSKTAKGEHRLVCGDCTDRAVVERVMHGERAVLGLHDPPYGISILSTGVGDGEWHGGMLVRRNKFDKLAGDELPFNPAHLLDSAKSLVLWGANHYADKLPPSAAWIVWDKREDLPSNDFSDAELAWVSTGGSVRIIRHHWNGLIRASERGEVRLHPTQKPVEVTGQIIETYTKQSEIVSDYYLGSGTTLVACEQTGRLGRGVEIEPKYCAVILERLAGLGLSPERIS